MSGWRTSCLRCGGSMGRVRKSDGICRSCVLLVATARRERIAVLSAEGRTPTDIAGVIDTSAAAIRVELWRLRHGRGVNTTGGPRTVVNR